VAFADEESDPFKKEVAETVAATQFDISSMWSDVEKLYVVELVNAEKIKLLYELITLTLLPEVTKDPELIKEVKEKIKDLNDRIRNLQEQEGIP
jgi:peptidoglycan hydrolase CwlO-like protein